MNRIRHPSPRRRALFVTSGLAVLVAALAAGCSPTAGTHPDGGASDAGATGTTTGTLSGTAFADLCHGLAGATVSVVGTRVTTTADDTGAFTLPDVPLPATLEVSAPGITTTRTAELDAATGIEAYAIPTDVVSQVYLLAGETAEPEPRGRRGDLRQRPPAPRRRGHRAPGRRERQGPGAPELLHHHHHRQRRGPPRLRPLGDGHRPGHGLGDLLRRAARALHRAGCAHRLPGQGPEGGRGRRLPLGAPLRGHRHRRHPAPAQVYGTVTEGPALPKYGPPVPTAGVQVTLHLAGGDQTATTDADGSFSFDLTDARQEADLTFAASGVLTQRSLLFCAGSTFFYSEVLNDTFWSQETLSSATLGGHLDLTKGQVALSVLDSVSGATFSKGVQVTATPAVAPFYGPGTPPTPADPCAVGSCQSQSDCASDTWCAPDNQCRVGASPVCELCQSAGNACPTGTLSTSFQVANGTGTTVGPCVCLQTVPDCTSTDCPAHTACQHDLMRVQGATPGSGTVTVQGAICAPDYSPATGTIDAPVVFPNLAPGTYTFTADDGRPPVRARVEAGVEVGGDWRPSALF